MFSVDFYAPNRAFFQPSHPGYAGTPPKGRIIISPVRVQILPLEGVRLAVAKQKRTGGRVFRCIRNNERLEQIYLNPPRHSGPPLRWRGINIGSKQSA